jgi:hypothetical protein
MYCKKWNRGRRINRRPRKPREFGDLKGRPGRVQIVFSDNFHRVDECGTSRTCLIKQITRMEDGICLVFSSNLKAFIKGIERITPSDFVFLDVTEVRVREDGDADHLEKGS